MTGSPEPLVAHLFREEAGRMVTRLTHALGARHLDVAEDAVQDALLRALHTWPANGIPDKPAAWLFTVARHRALDRLRRDTWFREREAVITAAVVALGEQGLDEGRLPFGDADLCVMFLTCHPALSREARVALTLKTVCGFGVDEIAHAYLQPPVTVAQRLVRAKRTLRDTGAVAEMPVHADLVDRRAAVLESLYLMFNEGYVAHSGDHLTRPEVCEEAVRLTRLVAIAPDTACPEAAALLALMLLHSARLAARTSNEGDVLLLDAQDRRHWDAGRLAEGLTWFDRSAVGDHLSPYHVQAAIAATHAAAPDMARTNWPRIVSLYDQLDRLVPSPVVRLNRAVALAQWQGAAAGLAALEADLLLSRLDGYYLAHAVRGTLLGQVGRTTEAVEAFGRALACGCSAPERRLIERRRTAAQRTLLADDGFDGGEARGADGGVGAKHQPDDQRGERADDERAQAHGGIDEGFGS